MQGETITSLDPANPDVAATVIEGRTVLPLRAFAERFGANVSYDAATRVAIVEHNGSRYLFPIDEQHYTAEANGTSKTIPMDTSSTILNSRTMVPLRVLAENVFQKKVSYYNRVIAVGDSHIDLASHGAIMLAVQSKIGVALKAQSFEEVKTSVTGSYNYFYFRNDMVKTDSMPTPTPAPSQSPTESTGSTNNSTIS